MAEEKRKQALALLEGLGLNTDQFKKKGVAQAHALLQTAGIDIDKAPRKPPSIGEVLVQLGKEAGPTAVGGVARFGQMTAKGVGKVGEQFKQIEREGLPTHGLTDITQGWQREYFNARSPLRPFKGGPIDAITGADSGIAAEQAKYNALANQNAITRAATAVSGWFEKDADALAKEANRIRNEAPEYLHQSLYDNPGLLGSGAYMTYNIGSGAMSMLPPIAAGVATWTATRNPVATSLVFRSMAAQAEAGSLYDQSIATGMSKKEATKNYAKMFTTVYITSGFGTGRLMSKVLTGATPLKKVGAATAISALEETSFEMYEELLGGALTNQDFKQSLKDAVNVIPATLAMSVFGGAVFAHQAVSEHSVGEGVRNQLDHLNKHRAKLSGTIQFKIDKAYTLVKQEEYTKAQNLVLNIADDIDAKHPEMGAELWAEADKLINDSIDDTVDAIPDEAFEGAVAEAEVTEEQKLLFDLGEKKRKLADTGVATAEIEQDPEVVAMTAQLEEMRKEPEVEAAPETKVEEPKAEVVEEPVEVAGQERVEALQDRAAAIVEGPVAEPVKDWVDSHVMQLSSETDAAVVEMYEAELNDIEGDVAAYVKGISQKQAAVAKFKAQLDPATIHDNETVTDYEFANISDEHAAMLQFWRAAQAYETLQPIHIETMKDVLRTRKLDQYTRTVYQLESTEALGTALNTVPIMKLTKVLGDLNINRGLETFWHELGHIWKHHIATPEQRQTIDNILGERTPAQREAQFKQLGIRDDVANHMGSSIDESFVGGLMLYAGNKFDKASKLNSIYKVVVNQLKEIFTKLNVGKLGKDFGAMYEQVFGEPVQEIVEKKEAAKVKEPKPADVKAEPETKPKPKAKPTPKPELVYKSYEDITQEEFDTLIDEIAIKADEKGMTFAKLQTWVTETQIKVNKEQFNALLEDADIEVVDGKLVDEASATVAEVQKSLSVAKDELITIETAWDEQGMSKTGLQTNPEYVKVTQAIDKLEAKLKYMKADLAAEPVTTDIHPVNAPVKSWAEVRRDTRAIIEGKLQVNEAALNEEVSTVLDKHGKHKFPGLDESTAPEVVLQTVTDEKLFKRINDGTMQLKVASGVLKAPHLASKDAIDQVSGMLLDAQEWFSEANEYINDIVSTGKNVSKLLKHDLKAAMIQTTGIVDMMEDITPELLHDENVSNAYSDMALAYSELTSTIGTVGNQTFSTDTNASTSQALTVAAREAKDNGMNYVQWMKTLDPSLKKLSRAAWIADNKNYNMPTENKGGPTYEVGIRNRAAHKTKKAIFTTKEMVQAIANYKGPDIKQYKIGPMIYILEQMDKMIPGVGFAKLADRYQGALTLHNAYLEHIFGEMNQAMKGVNTYKLGVFAAVKDTPKMRAYLVEQKVKVDDIIAEVSANPKAMKAYMLGRQYFNEMWAGINKTRMRLGHDPIPYRADYFTFIHASEKLNQNFNSLITAKYEEIVSMFTEVEEQLGGYHSGVTAFSFTERRPGPKPVELEYMKVFRRYSEIASKHMHFSPVISAVREMTSTMYVDMGKDKPQVVSMRQKGLVNMLDQLQRWGDFLAGNKNRTELLSGVHPVVEKVVGKLSNNIAVYTMGAVLRTVIIQPTANYLTALGIGAKYIYSNGLNNFVKAHMLSDPEMQRRLDMSKHLPTRQADVMFDELSTMQWDMTTNQALNVGVAAINRIQRGAFKGIQVMDMWTAQIGWLGAFDYFKDNGLSDKQAAIASDRLIAKTHGGSAPGLRAPIQRTVLGRALTLFQTFQLNEIAYLWNEVVKTDSMTIPGMEQANDDISAVRIQLTKQGINEEHIEAHPAMKKVRAKYGKLGEVWDDVRIKKEQTRRIMMYFFLTAMINSFYEDFIGINSPTPAPVRAMWQAYANDDDATKLIMAPIMEFAKQIPVVGGGAYGGGLIGATSDYVDDVTDILSGKRGASKPASELLGKTFGIPLLHQINKSMKSYDAGGSWYEVSVGMYPGHRRMMIDMLMMVSEGDTNIF